MACIVSQMPSFKEQVISEFFKCTLEDRQKRKKHFMMLLYFKKAIRGGIFFKAHQKLEIEKACVVVVEEGITY